MQSDVPWAIGLVKRSGRGVETLHRGLQGAVPAAQYRIGAADRMVFDQIG